MKEKKNLSFEWIQNNSEKLPSGEWVAADEFGMVAHNPKFQDLMDELKKKGVDISLMSIALIPEGKLA